MTKNLYKLCFALAFCLLQLSVAKSASATTAPGGDTPPTYACRVGEGAFSNVVYTSGGNTSTSLTPEFVKPGEILKVCFDISNVSSTNTVPW
ncbi:hypothetical protein [Pontibacter sp. CAU 1760]